MFNFVGQSLIFVQPMNNKELVKLAEIYLVPKDNRKSIDGDYKRIGKDLYKAFDDYKRKISK